MRISGIVSNLDWEQLVDQLMQVEARPMNLLMQQKSAVERQQGMWIQAGTLLTSFRTAAASLDDSKLFNQFAVSSSHDDLVTASVSGHVTPGSYEINVKQLAQAHTVASTNLGEGVGLSGKLVVGGGNGSPTVEIDVEAGDTAMALAGKINSAMEIKMAELKATEDPAAKDFVAVRAQVIDDRLVLTRGDTGDAEIQIADEDAGVLERLGLTTLRDGKDAKVTINGLEVTSGSNTLTAVPGLTIDLHQADDSTTIKLSVSQDRKSIEGKVNAFVTAYNNLVKQMGQWTDKGQPLQGDSLARSMMDNVRRRLSYAYGQGEEAMTLMAMGISTSGTANTISFDADAFWQAYDENPEAVEAALKAAASEFEQYVKTYLGTQGVLKSRDDSFSARTKTLDSSIERMQQRLTMRRQTMVNRFVRLEQLMSQMMSQGDWLAMQTQSLNMNWRGAGGANRR